MHKRFSVILFCRNAAASFKEGLLYLQTPCFPPSNPVRSFFSPQKLKRSAMFFSFNPVVSATGCKLPADVHVSIPAQRLRQGRTIIVGDIHGCATEFRQLLETVDYKPGHDLLILAGDLVNKGPASAEVSSFLMLSLFYPSLTRMFSQCLTRMFSQCLTRMFSQSLTTVRNDVVPVLYFPYKNVLTVSYNRKE